MSIEKLNDFAALLPEGGGAGCSAIRGTPDIVEKFSDASPSPPPAVTRTYQMVE